MKFSKQFELIRLIQDKTTSYARFIEFLYGETPPADHNFLARMDTSCISDVLKSDSYDDSLEILGNPNPRATVGYIIEYPFHFYIYKNIYRYMPESEFIIDGLWIRRNVKEWKRLLSEFMQFLLDEGVHFRVFYDGVDPEIFFQKYEVLVSNANKPVLDLPCNADKKKVRVMYGHSKDLWNFGAWSRNFNLALVYGPYSQKAISRYTRSQIVGNARFDDWFRPVHQKESQRISLLKKKLDPEKKTLLYLPTHGHLSSLELLQTIIPDLLRTYNLVIKPHQLTIYTEAGVLERFKRSASVASKNGSPILIDDYFDLSELFRISDLVISDNSGAIFDAVLVDKPVVLLDNVSSKFLGENAWKVTRRSRDVWEIPLTYDRSIEQRVKHDPNFRVAEVVSDITKLPAAILNAFKLDGAYRIKRLKIKKFIFNYCDGSSGRRSARAIRSLFHSKVVPSKTFLALQVDAEIVRETIYLKDEIKRLQKILRSYMNISPLFADRFDLREVLFSVIVPTYNRRGAILRTLESLVGQEEIGGNNFEIIIVDDGSTDDTKSKVREFICQHPAQKVLYVGYKENRGAAFARNIGILHARGDFIAFTDDDCIVPTDWLSNFKKDFDENREVAGVGGWYEWQPNTEAQELTAVGRYLRWLVFSAGRRPNKLSRWRGNICGNTANICYRKSVLMAVGGFNYYYPAATAEDTELAIRIEKANFVLLYMPRMIQHQKKYSFQELIRNNLLRGLAGYIIAKIHPDYGFIYF